MRPTPTQDAKIGITLGDPAGIGPEIVAKTITGLDAARRARIHVFGPRDRFEQFCDAAHAACLSFTDTGPCASSLGQPNKHSARAQVVALEEAVSAAKEGLLAALCTAPINKHQAALAGFDHPGHTEFLAARFDVQRVAMMFVGPRFRVVLATVHHALKDVPTLLSIERIVSTTRLAIEAVQQHYATKSPHVVILGLNPHAGENGRFGSEEQTIIAPAIAALRDAYPTATFSGPLAPDTAFRADADLWVAMYHDQALIPIKLVDFERTVNVTLGLPIPRTSPDHGVAYDIAAQRTADHRPFAHALDLAFQLAPGR